ncbi:hypothetical protein PGTUg99_006590 [Puccinia graminis f. sp. tritici]|uniref:Benzoate 4-monooxygenase cytochrome P450 n=1 Tax=Puccinia graminis f. sp. tritici TaxID=56615 RepID=A0A5B0QZA1_PUCGR|nr:hypothetical protein PGTUg99_006590 [Puccinia graminis f. sp. tritici]
MNLPPLCQTRIQQKRDEYDFHVTHRNQTQPGAVLGVSPSTNESHRSHTQRSASDRGLYQKRRRMMVDVVAETGHNCSQIKSFIRQQLLSPERQSTISKITMLVIGLIAAFLEYSILLGLVGISCFYLTGYLRNKHQLNRYPGPFLAKFSRLWLGYATRFGNRYQIIHQLHQKHGRFVRIAPNELSIADPDAVHIVLGHGTGTTKSKFYDAFVAIHRGLFNTRDRADHTRKRKIISSTFSQKSILEFEPYIADTLACFLRKMDQVASEPNLVQLPPHSLDSKHLDKHWRIIDILPWFNYLAFDIIGDLAFGERFGMIERGADIAAVEKEGKVIYLPAIQILNERGEFSATQGSLPAGLRPYMKYIDPWFSRGAASVQNLTGIATNQVNLRISQTGQSRRDLLARLQTGQDADGNPMGKDELIAEALTQLIAGSDTTSNSSCAILWWVVKHPGVHKRLMEELDEHLGTEEGVISYADCKELKYLNACINETLRIHSTSSIGLPRILPQTVSFKGHILPKGLVCSVPTFEIHHDPDVWGDPFTFRPERWLEPNAKDREKAFMPFSCGPRSCIGRNLAMMELYMITSTIFKRYEFALVDPNLAELETREGFLRKLSW